MNTNETKANSSKPVQIKIGSNKPQISIAMNRRKQSNQSQQSAIDEQHPTPNLPKNMKNEV